MSVLRTLLASLLILVAGVAALAAATDGFRAFTSETARRLDVREHPRALPRVPLQTATGQTIDIAGLRGRWLLVDFIYTRCVTYCSVQGSEFARLQDRLAGPIAGRQVVLLSISFDPAHDGPPELAAYQQRSGDRGAGWIAARPVRAADLAALKHAFGVTVIPDGLGGYVHNAAIAVVDPRGRLVAITDWDAPGEAAGYVLRRQPR
ncbi:MAG: SCO family protein [Rhodanobacteraceae bacterium]|nr:MAG: SCO family protein [Rhodanobacteraceae bacterium]